MHPELIKHYNEVDKVSNQQELYLKRQREYMQRQGRFKELYQMDRNKNKYLEKLKQ